MSTVPIATWQCSRSGLRASRSQSLWLALKGSFGRAQARHNTAPVSRVGGQINHSSDHLGVLSRQIKQLHQAYLTATPALSSGRLPSPIRSHLRAGHRPFSLSLARVPFQVRLVRSSSTESTSQTTDAKPASDARPEDDTIPTQQQLNAIFGTAIDREGAASLLSELQKQRRDGTLDQPLPYAPILLERGLAYLRSKYPVDEDAAIIARLDREFDGEWSLPQTRTAHSKTGDSGLMEIRRINKAKRAAEKAAREREETAARQRQEERRQTKERTGKGGAMLIRGQTKGLSAVDRPLGGTDSKGKELVLSERMENLIMANDARIRASNAWVARYRKKATPQYIPQMTTWQRLWPSGVFTFSLVGLALIFANVYTPPEHNARLFPDTPPAAAAVGTLVAINVLIFLAWRIPPLWPTLNRQFIIVPAIPQAFSMLGAEFSHKGFGHMVSNMLGLWLIGINLHDDIGRGPFIALVASGAVVSSFASMSSYVIPKIFITASLGASGILCTFLGAACILREGQSVRLPIIPPEYTSFVNTAVVLAILVATEVIQLARYGRAPKALVNSGKEHVDRVGHLGGYATGVAAGLAIRKVDDHWANVPRHSFWRPKAQLRGEVATSRIAVKPERRDIVGR